MQFNRDSVVKSVKSLSLDAIYNEISAELYLWVFGSSFLNDGGYSYSARGDAMLSFHRDGLPHATFRDEVLGHRFSGGTSMETTAQFFPWE